MARALSPRLTLAHTHTQEKAAREELQEQLDKAEHATADDATARGRVKLGSASACSVQPADQTAQMSRLSDELDKQTERAHALQQALSREQSKSALLDEQIIVLKAHLARLDAEFTAELEKEEVLAKQLEEEKHKELELAGSLKKAMSDLDKKELDLNAETQV